ncbi:hypothetical protein CR513_01973, partial [Mucuna pruriens]
MCIGYTGLNKAYPKKEECKGTQTNTSSLVENSIDEVSLSHYSVVLRATNRGTWSRKFMKGCQRFAEVNKAPLEQLHSITSPWPFHKWGVDILGPFPPAPGQVKYLIVAVDYFTKWIKAEPVVMILAERIKRFY